MTCDVSRCDRQATTTVTFTTTGDEYRYCRYHARPHVEREAERRAQDRDPLWDIA